MTFGHLKITSIQDALNEFAALACSMPSTAEEVLDCTRRLVAQAAVLEQLSSSTDLQGLAYSFQVLVRGLNAIGNTGLKEEDFETLTIWSMSCAAYLDGQLSGEAAGSPIDELMLVQAIPMMPETMHQLIHERLVTDAALFHASHRDSSLILASDGDKDNDIETPALAIIDDGSISPQNDTLLGFEPITALTEFKGETGALEFLAVDNEAVQMVDSSQALATPETDEAVPSADVIWISPEELELVSQAIDEQLITVSIELATAADHNSVQASAQTYLDNWQLISSAFEAIGLHPMQPFIEDVNEMLSSLINGNGEQEHARLLAEWPLVLTGYLSKPNNLLAVDDLVQLLSDSHWPKNNNQAQREALAYALSKVCVGYDPKLLAQRKTVAEIEDIELKIAEDVLPAVLDGMLRELPARSAEFTQMVNSIVRTGHPEAIDVARRIAHTLKGDGSIVGVRGIAVLTHSLEEILLVLAKNPGVPVPELADVLIESADCLEAMSDHLLGRGAPPENAMDVLQKVLNWDTALHGSDPVDAIICQPVMEADARTSSQNIDMQSIAVAPVAAESTPAVSAGPGASINVPTSLLNQLLRMAGEAILYSRQIENRAERLEQRIHDITNDNDALFKLVAELQQLVEVSGAASGSAREAMGDELDALEMEQYNELHTVTTRLVETATDSRATSTDLNKDLDALKDLLLSQDRVHLDLQDKMLATLSVPASGMVPRFQRIARQAARKLGKEIDIIIRGENTPIDNEVLDQLAEPMAHLLRNAVDHGLESHEERELVDKPAQGQLSIEFAREGNQVLVRVSDDGRGIDHQAILERAIERGIVDKDANLSEDEIARLIFRSGLSTRDEASEISGRGIGMDIVLRAINRMKGSLSIQSELGKGTRFDIRLPISQVVANIILVRSQMGWLAVSLQGVEKLLSLNANDFFETDQGIHVMVDDQIIPAQHIENAYGMTAPADRMQQALVAAMLVKSSEGIRKVVFVEQLSDSRTVIVKSMGPHLPAMPGIRGGTILGDGSIAPVVDLAELLNQAEGTHLLEQDLRLVSSLPNVLVVDDSLSVRRAMQSLLSDSGFDVRTARDGLEAVELIRERAPDILLVDLEMPRMNGLELSAFARNFAATKNTPIIMITSRTTERHKELASEVGIDHVLTKPYQDDELLDLIQHYMVVS
jgi:chemotaxis protein histidine kinase CheA/ActR/RegA family two-component response regulator